MRRFALAAALVLGLAWSMPAQARSRATIVLPVLAATLFAAGVTLLGVGAWAHYSAPDAPTLMEYERRNNISTALEVPGGACLLLTVPVSLLSGLLIAHGRRDRHEPPRRSLLEVRPGLSGLALGGTF